METRDRLLCSSTTPASCGKSEIEMRSFQQPSYTCWIFLFFRFRMGTDPNLQAEEILKRSTHNLADEDDLDRDQQQLQRNSRMEDGLRASQSFDESVRKKERNSLVLL